MAEFQGIAANISTYPGDVKHFKELFPHHIRVWGPSVDRFVVTIDTHQARAGRYRSGNFERNLEQLRTVVEAARRNYPAIEAIDVDYSPEARRAVAQYFFNRDMIPAKAWDGGYFHSFLYGLWSSKARYVMHFDGDMLFGGGSHTWIRQAIACIDERPDVFLTAPFPGPPRSDGRIFGHATADNPMFGREDMPFFAYRQGHLSSRAFFMDMNKFKATMGAFPWVEPSARQKLKAKLLGHEPEAIEAEALMSKGLQSRGMYRIDMLGSAPGMWSLHPPYRSEEFYRRLGEFIGRTERGELPDGQLGHFDLNDSVIDWTPARAATRWHKRYWKMLRDRLANFA
jgi:hypothetical protein